MKLFKSLALATLMIGSASATTYYVVGTCGSFSNPNPTPISGTFVCPTAAALGIIENLTVASEFLIYDSDYSNGLSGSVTAVTNWTFSGATFAFGSDTTTSTGGSSSSQAVSTDGLTFNASQSLPPTVLAGFYDVASAFGTPTINWTNQTTSGSAVATTGYAQVVYDYNVTSSTPEPVSMLLLGTGLVLTFLGRTPFVRRFFSKV
jgi:hypothetical protein